MEKKEKNKQEGISKVLFSICSLVVIVIFAILGYFYYTTQQELKDLRSKVNELTGEEVVKDEEPSNSNVTGSDVNASGNNTSTGKCGAVDGKYYGELIDTNLHMKQTYIFSSDGSYVSWAENSEGNSGYYVVADGSIYFLQKPTYGFDNSLNTFYYSISDDCKTITAYAGEKSYTLTKVE